ncbi:hypothetical protein EW145_g8652 [Phellinidium pouzarii]|uniref:Uncharacterized protein n=1 Tax=Phellinidium pouzarii TaxID=167371 RepID=A0A4S4K4F6_9AGAM|nr:hypothetical protein EW145_g8652 [Phellinidium pouzarii]
MAIAIISSAGSLFSKSTAPTVLDALSCSRSTRGHCAMRRHAASAWLARVRRRAFADTRQGVLCEVYGYEPEGPEFEEDGAPHQKMVARLCIPELDPALE